MPGEIFSLSPNNKISKSSPSGVHFAPNSPSAVLLAPTNTTYLCIRARQKSHLSVFPLTRQLKAIWLPLSPTIAQHLRLRTRSLKKFKSFERLTQLFVVAIFRWWLVIFSLVSLNVQLMKITCRLECICKPWNHSCFRSSVWIYFK
jgi:hypothetical protein